MVAVLLYKMTTTLAQFSFHFNLFIVLVLTFYLFIYFLIILFSVYFLFYFVALPCLWYPTWHFLSLSFSLHCDCPALISLTCSLSAFLVISPCDHPSSFLVFLFESSWLLDISTPLVPLDLFPCLDWLPGFDQRLSSCLPVSLPISNIQTNFLSLQYLDYKQSLIS